MILHAQAYLASPYSDRRCHAIAESEAAEAAAELARAGVSAWSPVVMGCGLERADVVIREHWTHGDWLAWCLPWLARTDVLVVLMTDGWASSRGVAMERREAEHLGIPEVRWDVAVMSAADVVAAVQVALAVREDAA